LIVGVIALRAVAYGVFFAAIVVLAIGQFVRQPYLVLGCPHCRLLLRNPGPICRGCGRDMRPGRA
jgi:hypothetical protein